MHEKNNIGRTALHCAAAAGYVLLRVSLHRIHNCAVRGYCVDFAFRYCVDFATVLISHSFVLP